MEAGRELDVLVAEKVFGMTLRNRFTNEEKPVTSAMALMHEDKLLDIPHFSTDIAAAWEILESSNLMDYRDIIRSYDGWHFVDVDDSGRSCGTFVKAKTMPHAICLAALKARGIEP